MWSVSNYRYPIAAMTLSIILIGSPLWAFANEDVPLKTSNEGRLAEEPQESNEMQKTNFQLATSNIDIDTILYIAKETDSIQSISRTFGVPVEELASLNGLQDPYRVGQGQLVQIPVNRVNQKYGSQEAVEYTVKKGDTLSQLGLQFDIPWPELALYNRLPDPDLILVGQALKIPVKDVVVFYFPDQEQIGDKANGHR